MGRTFIIEPGDWVIDESGVWEPKKVSHIVDESIYLENGEVLGYEHVTDVFLPGELDGYN